MGLPSGTSPGNCSSPGRRCSTCSRSGTGCCSARCSAHCRSCAVARRGFSRNHGGSPVASARSPMEPAPKSPVSRRHDGSSWSFPFLQTDSARWGIGRPARTSNEARWSRWCLRRRLGRVVVAREDVDGAGVVAVARWIAHHVLDHARDGRARPSWCRRCRCWRRPPAWRRSRTASRSPPGRTAWPSRASPESASRG